MLQPLVSVIIPLYNRAALVRETIDSLTAQTYPHWEALVVDDGSDDGSDEIIKDFSSKDRRVKYLKRERAPKGASTCRNIGIENAKGDYAVFLDSDDLLAPFCLEKRVACMQKHPELDFAVFNMLLFKEQLDDTNIVWNIATDEDDLARFLRGDGVWSITGPIHHISSLRKTGGFNENLPFWQDYEFHIRLLTGQSHYKKFIHLAPDCYDRRHQGESISQGGGFSPFKLTTKEKVFIHISILLAKSESSGEMIYKETCAAMFFKFSMQWVIYNHNLYQALQCWDTCYRQHLVGFFNYKVGRNCLKAKYWQKKHFLFYLPFGILYQLMRSFLPKMYRKPESLLCKVKLNDAK